MKIPSVFFGLTKFYISHKDAEVNGKKRGSISETFDPKLVFAIPKQEPPLVAWVGSSHLVSS